MAIAELRECEQLATELTSLGEARDDTVACELGYRTSGTTYFFTGEFAAARDCLENGLAKYDPNSQSKIFDCAATDHVIALLTYSSLAHVCCGYLDQGRSRGDAAITKSLQLGDTPTHAYALQLVQLTEWLARLEPKLLLELADELLMLSSEGGFPYWQVHALHFRGWCLVAMGHKEEGLACLAAGWADVHATETAIATPFFRLMQCDAYRMAGQYQTGLKLLAEAELFTSSRPDRAVLSEALRLRGDLLRLTGESGRAESSLHEAITVARRQQAKFFELRASTSLARLWRDQGKIADAHDLLAPIYGWFTEGFDAPDLVEAKALLDELGAALGRRSVAGMTATTRT